MSEQEEHQVYATQERISAARLELDPQVNPRTGNENWVRHILGEPDRDGRYAGYNRMLLGQFVISRREIPGEDPRYVILDGANRRKLMQVAHDLDYEVSCEVLHGMTIQQEAAHAKGLNDRRGWSPVRKFLADVTAGAPEATAIMRTLSTHRWDVGITKGSGVLTGVASLKNLIRAAERIAAAEAEGKGIRKGTEQHRAAVIAGRADGVRILDEAIQVVTIAWPDRSPNYTGDIIYGVGLLLLCYGRRVNLEKLSEQLSRVAGGKLAIVTSAKAIKQAHPSFKIADGVAQYVMESYNKSFSGRSHSRLDENWKPVAV